MTSRILTLRNIRRLYAVFFLALFVVLLWLTSFKHLKGYETPLFLELDPLTAVASFLTSWTLYKGLILSLFVIIGTLFLGRFFLFLVLSTRHNQPGCRQHPEQIAGSGHCHSKFLP